MLAGEARAIAQQWVEEEASKTAGFAGAFIAGSTNWLPEDDAFSPTSDIDIKLVLDIPVVPDGHMKVPPHGRCLPAMDTSRYIRACANRERSGTTRTWGT
jgi:hypothetical protein